MRFPEYLNDLIKDKNDLVKESETIYGLSSRIIEQKKDAQNKNLTLLVVSGFSGAGKDSIIEGLINTDNRFGWVRTCTTRARRREETDENDTYIRLTEEAFQKALSGGDVIEWVEYAGHHYCSLISIFEKAFEKYDIPVLRIDPKGSHFYSEKWREGKGLFANASMIYVFVVPPSIEALRCRLINRSGDAGFVDQRIAQLEKDIPYVNDAQYIVINETGELDLVVAELSKIISSS